MEASEGSERQTPSVKWQESWWRRRNILFFFQRPWPLLVVWQPWHRRRVRQKEHGAVRHAARHRSLSVGPDVTVIFLSDPSPCGIDGLTVKIAAPTHICTGLPHPTVQEIRECFMSASWVLCGCFLIASSPVFSFPFQSSTSLSLLWTSTLVESSSLSGWVLLVSRSLIQA